MKQILHYSLLAAAAVFFISCSKQSSSTNEEGIAPKDPQDETTVTPAEYDPSEYLLSFGAAFEEDKTKVVINVESGALSFEEGDEVLVYVPATGAQSVYVYDHTQSLFVPNEPEAPVAVGNNVAYVYYPSAEFTISSPTVTFTMPEAIAAGSAEDLGDKVPMAGIIPAEAKEDGHPLVTFKNLGSILRARFNSSATDGETITKVQLNVTGANITGAGTVSWEGETVAAVPSVTALEGGTTSITISVADGHLTNEAYKDFYFFLPASGVLTAMTIKATYGKTGGYEPYETVSRTEEMELKRNKIYKVQKSLSGFFSGGDGETYPYKISTVADFQAIATLANATQDAAFGGNRRNGYLDSSNRTFFGAAGVHYQQAADIDLNSAPLTPIGNSTRRFMGNYDGYNKKLNVNINVNNQFAAPFGYVDEYALIKDLTVTGTITKTGETNNSLAGGIAGILNGHAQITGCTNEATISSSASFTGGIAGRLYGDNAKISECSNEGTVGGAYNVGGIVGQQVHGIISKCVNSGSVTATDDKVGGIAGELCSTDAIISQDCSNSGTVEGVNDVGGVVGLITAADLVTADNSGKVTGSGQRIGGIIGHLNNATAKITGCNNTCNVEDAVKGEANVGGVVGLITHGEVSSCSNSAQVKATGTVASAGTGGIAGCMANDDAFIKEGCRNSGAIQGTEMVGGIAGVLILGTIQSSVNTGPVNGTSMVGGIVGFAGSASTSAAPSAICFITSCRTNANISGTANCVGGIAGKLQNGVVVSGCYTEGNVSTSTYDVGGLVGLIHLNYNDAKARVYVYDCLANMNVTTTRASGACRTGGAVGYITTSGQYVAIDNCGVLDVTITAAGQYVGGFAGWMKGDGTNSNRARIRNCYTLVSSVPGSSQKGGFIGAVTNKAELRYDYFVANDSSDISSDTVKNNYVQKTANEIKSDATCTAFNGNPFSLTVGSITYQSALNWAITNGYPVPGALIELGPEYHK